MLDHGANPNVKDEFTRSTALHSAAFSNNVEAIILLLQAGANIHSKDNLGGTPLHRAIEFNSYEALHTLLHLGAQLNQKDMLFGNTPLHTALKEDHFHPGLRENRYKIVALLLQYGADPLAQNKAGENALTFIRKEYVKARKKAQTNSTTKYKVEVQEYQKIARLLIAHIGLYTK